MKIRVVTSLVVAVALATTGGVVQAAKTRSATTITVRGTLRAASDPVTNPDCLTQGYQYSGTSVYTGTFEGTGVFCGKGTGIRSDGAIQFAETLTFTGTVRGCGTGSVTYTVEGVVYPPDPASQTLPAEEDWQIVASSGTDNLRGIRSGGGHNTGTINADGSIVAELNGILKCLPPRPRS